MRGAPVLAGGTDVYPQHVGRPLPEPVIDIGGIAELRGVDVTADAYRIGALTRWADVADAALPACFDGLRAAASQVGSVQVQNAGTVGGNLCNASPAADGIPPLLSLDASVELTSIAGSRVLSLEAFLTGYRQTALRPDELADRRADPARRGRTTRAGVPEARAAPLPGDLGGDGGGRGGDGSDDRIDRGPGGGRRMLAGGAATAIARIRAGRPVPRGGRRRARSPSISPRSARSTTSARRPTTGGRPPELVRRALDELRRAAMSTVTFDVNGSSVRADAIGAAAQRRSCATTWG